MKCNSYNNRLTSDRVDEAVTYLKNGEIISFPTETYYGLGVDPFNSNAVKRLFLLKKRDKNKAILLLVADSSSISDLALYIPEIYYPLMQKFWPGPLTLLFPAGKNINPLLTGGTGNIGIRVSSHPVAKDLLKIWKRPLTATSANISGKQPASTAKMVNQYFTQSVSCILDGGKSSCTNPSTIVGVENNALTMIREGQIPFDKVVNSLVE